MADAAVEIPKRTLFKAAEVCEIASVQPYVLRSWESEFPDLGVARTAGGPRVYRRADLERVLRIKQLVFGEGLTLAGARFSMTVAKDRSGTGEPTEEVQKRILGLFYDVKKSYDDVFDASDQITLDADNLAYVVGELQIYCIT